MAILCWAAKNSLRGTVLYCNGAWKSGPYFGCSRMQWLLQNAVAALECSGCSSMQWLLQNAVAALECSGCSSMQWLLSSELMSIPAIWYVLKEPSSLKSCMDRWASILVPSNWAPPTSGSGRSSVASQFHTLGFGVQITKGFAIEMYSQKSGIKISFEVRKLYLQTIFFHTQKLCFLP